VRPQAQIAPPITDFLFLISSCQPDNIIFVGLLMTRNNREIQYVRCCPECGHRIEWQKLTVSERREEGFSESLLGYYFCVNCGYKDMRGVDERLPGFVTCTNSTAAEVGVAADTLKRLHKTDPTLGFIVNEGGNLVSHPSSLAAWKFSYDDKKQKERRENVENYKGWLKTDPSSGKVKQ
jgi:hypothetical protein